MGRSGHSISYIFGCVDFLSTTALTSL